MKNQVKDGYFYRITLLCFFSFYQLSAPPNINTNDIVDGAVTTPKIANLAVTSAKIAANTITTNEISLTAGITGSQLASGTVANANLASGIDASKITTGTLPIARIADGTITGAKISGTTITGANIQNGTITTTQISSTAGITGSQLASGTVANANLASDIDASKITAGTLPIARIANAAVTGTKIALATVTGDAAGVGTGNLALNTIVVGNIADAAVTNAKLGALAVTDAKVNDVAAGKITGTIATGQIADLAVTTAKINDLAVTTGKINDLGVTTGKIADAAVTNAKLGALAVTDAKVNDVAAGKITGTIATGQIAALAVDNTKIAANTIGDGQITVGGIGTASLAAGAVTTAKILDANVTNAKLASDIDASKITAGTLPIARIANAAVTGTKIALATVTGDAAGVGTGNLALNTIVAGNIADAAVTNAKLGALAVTDAKVNDVAAGKITGTIATGQIADLAVTTAKINDLAVTTGKINDLGVTTGKIADVAVTNEKIASLKISKVTGNGGLALTGADLPSFDASKITSGVFDSARLGIALNPVSILTVIANNEIKYINGSSGSPTVINAFTYFEPGSNLTWDNSNGIKYGSWQTMFPAECHIDMKESGILELKTDLVLKGGGTFDSIGTIRSDSTVYERSEDSARAIVLSDFETAFPHNGSFGFSNNVGVPVTTIPDKVDSNGTVHIPVACSWTLPLPKESIVSVSNGGPSGTGGIYIAELNDPFTTLTQRQSFTSAVGEGQYTSVDVLSVVDQQSNNIFIAVTRLAAGSGKPSLQIYKYNPVTYTLSLAGVDGADVECMCHCTGGDMCMPDVAFDNMDVYAVSWRSRHGKFSVESNGEFMGPQLAITYKDSMDGLYYVSIIEFRFDGCNNKFILMESDKVQLLAKDDSGNFIDGSGKPVNNQLVWRKNGHRLALIAQDQNHSNTNDNVQLYDVVCNGFVSREPKINSTDGGQYFDEVGAPLFIPRFSYVVCAQATAIAYNPIEYQLEDQIIDIIAVARNANTDNLRMYSVMRTTPDQFNKNKDQLSLVSQIGGVVNVPGVTTAAFIKSMDWNTEGATLALSCQQDAANATTTGGIRLYSVNAKGKLSSLNRTSLDAPLDDTLTQGTSHCIRFNSLSNKIARANTVISNKIAAHLLSFSGTYGVEVSLENIKIILNSDITLNETITIGAANQGKKLIIKGNDHTMKFTDHGRIIIPNLATLILQDVKVTGVKSHDTATDTNVIESIVMDGVASKLVLNRAQLIPVSDGAQFIKGIISLIGETAQLGGEDKQIKIKRSDVVGDMQLQINEIDFSGITNFRGNQDSGVHFHMSGDTDFRGASFMHPTSINGHGYTLTINNRTFPATSNANVEYASLIPSIIVPEDVNAFDFEVNTIDTTHDVVLPIVSVVNKGNGTSTSGKLSLGIINPVNHKFVKGTTLTFSGATIADGQIADVAFKKTQPLEIFSSDGTTKYDRYFMAVLQTGSPTNNSGIKIYAVDVNQDFYKSDIYTTQTASDYEKLRSLSRINLYAPGTGSASLAHLSNTLITFLSTEKPLAMAMHPHGKKLAVVVDINTHDVHTYELRIYPLLDNGVIITDSTKVVKIDCGAPSSKNRPLKWCIDGKKLIYSSIKSSGTVQLFVKNNNLLSMTEIALGFIPTIAPHPYDDSLLAVAEDGVLAGIKRGIRVFDIDDGLIINEAKNVFITVPNSSSPNNSSANYFDLEWNPDGTMIAAATDKGLKIVTFNMTACEFMQAIQGNAMRMDLDRAVKAVKFMPDGITLIRGGKKFPDNNSSTTQSLITQVMPTKVRAEFTGITFDILADHALIGKIDVSTPSTLKLNRKILDIPSTGELKIASGSILTISHGRIRGLKTQRKANGQGLNDKMVNEITNIKFADSSSKLVLDAVEMELAYDADFIAPGSILIKTKDALVTGGVLNVPTIGSTKIMSQDGFTLTPDTATAAAVNIGSANNYVDTAKATVASNVSTQTLREQATLGVVAAQNFTVGQQQVSAFVRSSDGSRVPLALQGSSDRSNPTIYPFKDYMEMLGSGSGDITITGYVQIVGPTTTQDASKANITDNTTLRVADGANLIIKAGSCLTCTGQMSIIADKHSSIIIENTAQLIFGTFTTKTTDKLALVTFGGEIELQGPDAKICFSYGRNKIIGNPRSSIDVTEGGQFLINQTAQGVSTCTTDGTVGSTLVELTLNKTKIVGSPETNDAVFVIAPNDQVAGVENTTILNVKNIQCTGNTNTQFMAANGQYGIKAVLNAFDQKQTVNTAQLVERLTLAELPKNNQPINPARFDAHGDIQAASAANPLFNYTLYNTDKLYSIKRYTMHTGQEVVSGTDMFGHAFRQVKDGQRVS